MIPHLLIICKGWSPYVDFFLYIFCYSFFTTNSLKSSSIVHLNKDPPQVLTHIQITSHLTLRLRETNQTLVLSYTFNLSLSETRFSSCYILVSPTFLLVLTNPDWTFLLESRCFVSGLPRYLRYYGGYLQRYLWE